MDTPAERTDVKTKQELRSEAGRWLRDLRELRGLSQRDLASLVGTRYFTFISAIEGGRGRVPPDRYLVWAKALEVQPREFVHRLMSYYDPITFGILFEPVSDPSQRSQERSPKGPAWLSALIASLRRGDGKEEETTECSHSESR
ncbi:helix-turn-helix transcriptional regulator [Bradyrhizobium manausense]|nr:helix-turn-helix transcriptional regulator [Bradyrhizobium manausense]